MISEKEYLMGRDKTSPLTEEMKVNMLKLLNAVNGLLKEYGKKLKVSSGYRPPSVNSNVGGAKNSAHQVCEAIDLQDPNREFANWCIKNIHLLEKYGLYLEHPGWTPTWVHLQIRQPASKKRIFVPNSLPPLDPNFKI